MVVVICQLPGVLLGCLVCYIIVSGPFLISLMIARRVKRKNWDIAKWWKRGLIGTCCLAIAMTLAWAVVHAYM